MKSQKRKKMLKRKIIKRFVFIFLGTLVFSSCDKNISTKGVVDKTKIIENTNRLLNDWHIAASEANFENYFSKMDSISIFIGTDASENWPKKQFIDFSKPYFDKGKAWSFTAIERNIYSNEDGSFIWFDELLSTWMGICRGSGVIENKNNELKIKQYVLSVTIPNDDIQSLIKLKQVKDSIFQLKFN